MKLSEREKAKVIERYTSRYRKYGYSPMTLGWGKGGRQHIRFQVLTSFVDLKKCRSILDVGCGFGDLYGFMSSRGFAGAYVGVELVEVLAEEARKRYPEIRIISGDFLTSGVNEKFDLAIGSGIFNAKCHRRMHSYISEVLKKMLETSEVVAVDFMSVYVDFQRKKAFHADPKEIIDVARPLSNRIILRFDYMPYEFALFLFKNATITERNVFADFENKFGKGSSLLE